MQWYASLQNGPKAVDSGLGRRTKIENVAENNVRETVSVSNTHITLLSGYDNTCLFAADGKITLLKDYHLNKDKKTKYVMPDDLTEADLPKPSKLGTTSI